MSQELQADLLCMEKSSVRILVAEDNPGDLHLVRMALSESQIACEISVATDGEQAIRCIEGLDVSQKREPFDLLILDLHLPKHDGHEILNRLRASERSGQTPVLVLTSSPRGGKEISDRHAVAHFFQKPIGLEKFMALGPIVKGILDRRHGEEDPGRTHLEDSRICR
jgi:CheY-like chemotaxis protein